jgi:hypothetical protein
LNNSFYISGFGENNWPKKPNYSENEQNIPGKYWFSTWALRKWRSVWCCGKNFLFTSTVCNPIPLGFLMQSTYWSDKLKFWNPLVLSFQIRNCNNYWIFWSLHTNQYQDFLNWILTPLCLVRCRRIFHWFLIQVASLLRFGDLQCYFPYKKCYFHDSNFVSQYTEVFSSRHFWWSWCIMCFCIRCFFFGWHAICRSVMFFQLLDCATSEWCVLFVSNYLLANHIMKGCVTLWNACLCLFLQSWLFHLIKILF